jgi:peptide deformylase
MPGQPVDRLQTLAYLTRMSVLPIVTLPDPILRQISSPVERFDDDLRRLIADMFETMYDAPGIGLAGVQVGVTRRLLTLDVADDEETPRPLAMINPVILQLGDTLAIREEGCLSVPDQRLDIERPSTVRVSFQDLDGKQHEVTAEGLLATAIQHEVDHLDGKMIVDFMSKLRRDMVIRKFKKIAKTNAPPPPKKPEPKKLG